MLNDVTLLNVYIILVGLGVGITLLNVYIILVGLGVGVGI